MTRVDELVARGASWLAADPDPETREQLHQAMTRRDPVELEELLGTALSFGTAGLRGPLGPGPNRMNRAVARRTAAGLASHLRASWPAGARHSEAGRRGVVVGHDARYGSSDFADEITDELVRHGIDVCRFDGPVPTPLTAFALLDGDHGAGVMVTASHNPASDNGIKIFDADGAQIAPPVDSSIAAYIDAPSDPGAVVPGRLRSAGDMTSGPVARRYIQRAVALAGRDVGAGQLSVAYTALHGMGAELLERVLDQLGGHECHPVASQRRPDPDFPTAPRPNPEEPGVLDELLSLADAIDADLAVALDPDADRLAVAVRGPGSWRVLTGDELGVLFAGHLIDTTDAPAGSTPDRLVTSTIVSSRLTGRLCASRGVRHVETLTGFKWLCRPGLAHPELRQLLMYEEALGYGIGTDARDKDGIAAAAVACAMFLAAREAGRSLLDLLDDLARDHGAHVTRNGSIRTDTAAAAGDAGQPMAPARLGGVPVVSVDRPAPEVTRWYLEDDTRVILRPSGTEPKLKYYCEAVEPLQGRSPEDASAVADERLEAVVEDLLSLVLGSRSGS